MTDSGKRFQLATVAFFGRTLSEYLRMFALDPAALRGKRVLDVASGPGSFVAEAVALGLDATGCDPAYAGDPDLIVARGTADIESCREQIRKSPGVLAYRDIDAFYRQKYLALERFAADFRLGRSMGRYVAAALPRLPFADASFDLVLSGNFLMIYAPLADGGMHAGNDFDLEFHRLAIRELARVTRGELRVTGIHTWTQPPKPHPYCEPVTRALEDAGCDVRRLPIDYDDGCQTGGEHVNQVLVAHRRSTGQRPAAVPS